MGVRGGYRIVLPIGPEEPLEPLVRLAVRLLPPEGGEVYLVGVVQVPEDRPLSEGALPAQQIRQRLDDLIDRHPHWPLRLHDQVEVEHVPWPRLLLLLRQVPVQLLMAVWPREDGGVLGVPAETVLSQAPCDLILVRPTKEPWEIRRVLLPLRGGPHAEFALRVARAVAGEGRITLLHVSDTGAPPPDLRALARQEPQITRTVTLFGDPGAGIVEETEGHQAVVLGATLYDAPGGRFGLGEVVREVVRRTEQLLFVVRSFQPGAAAFPEPEALPQILTRPDVHTRVERWFATNTFHSREFEDLEELVRLKEARGETISLVLPALNEEETIGRVIDTVKSALMDQVPLLDEILLMDSNSTDRTREIAAERGIPVYIHQHVLTEEVGSHHGKGEALWKSLYVARGDIVVWIDTDIVNIHPRFVYGLLGPLLRWDRLLYVKGFYRRPLRVGNRIQAGGGGRVTELVARPMFNLFFPELSGIIQPLSGEYAGRRRALERLPFFTGYGVETGLLIDFLESFGLESIAQVDLQERIHHNQPLVNLSKMAFAILQVFISRLEARNKVRLLEEINRSMKIIRYEPGRFYLELERIAEEERPPMITVPAYQRRLEAERAPS